MFPVFKIISFNRFRLRASVRTYKMNIKTFVFFDMETTGLPHLEYFKTKITELSLVAVQSDHIELGVFPRVQNKLSMCFNPNKLISLEASKNTGLIF